MGKIKILVTGHDGFIGKSLMTVYQSDIEFVPFSGNLLCSEDIQNTFKEHSDISQIIHLAGIFFGQDDDLFKINVLGTYNLLNEAKHHKINKLIFASSGAVYGEPKGIMSLETDELSPNTVYGLTKKLAEEEIKYFYNNFEMGFVILRFPNVYGPHNNKGVIYNFLKSIRENKKITIDGNGKQSRNFLYIDDAIDSILKSVYFQETNIFNIADKDLYNLNDVVAILRSLGLNFDIEYQNVSEVNKLKVLSENILKAKHLLKWEPKNSLNNGLQKIINSEYFL